MTLEELIYIHIEAIDRFGGVQGIRDSGLLESALARPATSFSGIQLYSTPFDRSAALLASLIQNPGFIDRNKRTGVAAMIVWLNREGWELEADDQELVEMAISVAEHGFSLGQISEGLRQRCKEA
ncbi:MAG: type II toxin-antitoxin system death-on-curing family toxin [Candidatus Dormibacteraceae bacterium]